jgi:hypothetical protein
MNRVRELFRQKNATATVFVGHLFAVSGSAFAVGAAAAAAAAAAVAAAIVKQPCRAVTVVDAELPRQLALQRHSNARPSERTSFCPLDGPDR